MLSGCVQSRFRHLPSPRENHLTTTITAGRLHIMGGPFSVRERRIEGQCDVQDGVTEHKYNLRHAIQPPCPGWPVTPMVINAHRSGGRQQSHKNRDHGCCGDKISERVAAAQWDLTRDNVNAGDASEKGTNAYGKPWAGMSRADKKRPAGISTRPRKFRRTFLCKAPSWHA